MKPLNKLKRGDKVAILSPSSAAPALWPHVYDLGLKRLHEVFGLIPIEFPTTKKMNATAEEKIADLESAFSNPEIKAIITTIGGDDEVTYVKNINPKVFIKNPKPFFGFSDNTHLANFLWINGISSYYGGSIFTQYAIEGKLDSFTKRYLEIALFNEGEFELEQSKIFNDKGLNWDNVANINKTRHYEQNEGWIWDGDKSIGGITWGGCLESIDDLLRHGIRIPALHDFKNIVLITETSEEIPSSDYCFRVYRALGERGILTNIQAVLVGRPQAWFFDKQLNSFERRKYRVEQREIIINTIRKYNSSCPIIQNMDFGHTNPQIPIPYGKRVRIDSESRKIYADF